jgi:hypothetical protein
MLNVDLNFVANTELGGSLQPPFFYSIIMQIFCKFYLIDIYTKI